MRLSAARFLSAFLLFSGPVGGLSLGGNSLSAQEPQSPEERRRLLERRPFEPAPAPEPTEGRTLFYRESPSAEPPRGSTIPAPEGAADLGTRPFPIGATRTAGWVVPLGETLGSVGQLRGLAGGQETGRIRTTLLRYDRVEVELTVPAEVSVGERLVLARLGRDLPGVGRIVAPTAVVTVERVEGVRVEGSLEVLLGRVTVDDVVFLERPPAEGGGTSPAAGGEALGLTASLLAFQEEKILQQPGDFLFIDRGGRQGVQVGDEWVAVGGADEGWSGQELARFRVVLADSQTSTLRIHSLVHPEGLRPGMTLRLRRTSR